MKLSGALHKAVWKMRISHKIVIVSIAALISIFIFFEFQKNKSNLLDNSLNTKVTISTPEKICLSREPIFNKKSICVLPQKTIQKFHDICLNAIHHDYIMVKKMIVADNVYKFKDFANCLISRPHYDDKILGWQVIAITHTPFHGFPPQGGQPLDEINDSFLGANCENFGEIRFECKLDKNGNCLNLKVISKNDQSDYLCLDGIEY